MLACTPMTFQVHVSTQYFALAFRPEYPCASMSIGASEMILVPSSTVSLCIGLRACVCSYEHERWSTYDTSSAFFALALLPEREC